MSYISKNLVDGEVVLYTARRHWLQKINPVQWIILWGREIAITNRRLIYKRGVIARKTEELNLRRVEEINLKQGVFGRIFGYGRLQIHGTGAGVVEIPIIARPGRFKKELIGAQVRAEK